MTVRPKLDLNVSGGVLVIGKTYELADLPVTKQIKAEKMALVADITQGFEKTIKCSICQETMPQSLRDKHVTDMHSDMKLKPVTAGVTTEDRWVTF